MPTLPRLLCVACSGLLPVLTGCAHSASMPQPRVVRAAELPAAPPSPTYVSYRQTSFNAPANVSIGELPQDLTGWTGIFPGEPAAYQGGYGSSGYSNHDHYFRPGGSCAGGYGGYSGHCRTGYITITPLRSARR